LEAIRSKRSPIASDPEAPRRLLSGPSALEAASVSGVSATESFTGDQTLFDFTASKMDGGTSNASSLSPSLPHFIQANHDSFERIGRIKAILFIAAMFFLWTSGTSRSSISFKTGDSLDHLTVCRPWFDCALCSCSHQTLQTQISGLNQPPCL
jgi:hypothetical protein